MLSMEAVVAVEAALLVVVLRPHQGVFALLTDEALVVPTLLPVRDVILHMYRELAAAALLCHGVLLQLPAPVMLRG